MAVLSAAERLKIRNGIMRLRPWPGSLLKADLAAAVNATDTWIDANAAAYSAAIPLPARTAMSATDKTVLFCYVAMRRAGLLPVQEDTP